MSKYGIESMSVTFHIAFAFKNDERIASAAPVFVAHDSHTFNAAEALKLSPEVVLRGVLVLWEWSDVAYIQLLRDDVPDGR